MPYQPLPKFKSTQDSMLQIPLPAIGGLNLKDLEFEQEVNQSPYMKNVMYRNGAFGKRYGQEVHSRYPDKIYSAVYFNGDIIIHVGDKICKYITEGTSPYYIIAEGLPNEKGLFIIYAQSLYYLISSGFYHCKFDGTDYIWENVEPYIPDVLINCKPDGSHSDPSDDYNVLGSKFSFVFNGEQGVSVYKFSKYDSVGNRTIIDWDITPTITVDEEEVTNFTVDKVAKTITFATAPPERALNVVVTFTMLPGIMDEERQQILSCKYYDTFGGSNNSRLFLAGCGNSKYFYSEAYDLSYFPDNNFASLGNTEEDITGFGRQYNVLIVFKPKEIYSIYSFVENATTTLIEENFGFEGFKSQLVNARVGCDAPYSIQLVNNLLTWFNSTEGICTLVSTNIQNERNVRTISRNIEKENNFGIKGILDYNEDLTKIQSANYDNKYFLVFPESGDCFMWDFEIVPYKLTNTGETPHNKLDWFLFDNFYVGQFLKVEKDLLYACSHKNFENSMIKLNMSFSDVNFEQKRNEEGKIMDSVAIHSFYMTPFLQFGVVECLKNVKNIYVQCRGDTASVIDMYYYTEESSTPEKELESIRIGGRLWEHFKWHNFQWLVVNWANTFRRRCNLKKIQMASFYFENNELDRDMSITHIGIQYQIIKYIR